MGHLCRPPVRNGACDDDPGGSHRAVRRTRRSRNGSSAVDGRGNAGRTGYRLPPASKSAGTNRAPDVPDGAAIRILRTSACPGHRRPGDEDIFRSDGEVRSDR